MTNDTLQKFGTAFQNKTISAIVSDEKFTQRIIEIIDSSFFESDANQFIVQKIKTYHKEYGVVPTVEALSVIIKKEADDKKHGSFLEQLRTIYDGMRATDLEFVKEEVLVFCKNQKMKNAILESVTYLQNGQYELIQSIITDALQAGEEPHMGHMYKDDIEARFAVDARKTIQTGLSQIDQLMGGGLGPGELGCIIGTAGGGKSWFLAHTGLAGMIKGKNVAHYTLELNELYTAHRYDTCLTHIPLQDLHTDPTAKPKVAEMMLGVPGNLIVTQYPTKFATPYTILNHQKRLRTLGIQTDMIIVDYADLLSTGAKQDSLYEAGGTIYEQLRGVAGELNVPLWTVSQASRSGMNDEIIEADKIAESFKKVMTADFVASISRKTEDKLNQTARLHVIKNRFGADGMTFNLKMDTERGIIELLGNSEDSIELTKTLIANKNSNNGDSASNMENLRKRLSQIR